MHCVFTICHHAADAPNEWPSAQACIAAWQRQEGNNLLKQKTSLALLRGGEEKCVSCGVDLTEANKRKTFKEL